MILRKKLVAVAAGGDGRLGEPAVEFGAAGRSEAVDDAVGLDLLEAGNGHAGSALSVPGAVILVPGPSAAVVTLSHSTTYLLRLAG